MFTPETQPQFNLDIPVAPETATLWVRKRDARRAPFDEARIGLAIEGAFRDVRELGRDTPLPADVQLSVDCLAQAVAQRALGAAHEGRELEIELIQDLVETELMRSGQHDVARGFILFREERRKARILRAAAGEEDLSKDDGPALSMTLPDGSVQPLDVAGVRRELIRACAGHEQICDWRELAEETLRSVYDGVKIPEVEKAMLFAAKARVERDPAYSFVAARLLLNTIYREVFETRNVDQVRVGELHVERFEQGLRLGVEAGRLDAKLLDFDLARLAQALRPERDRQFQYMGIQTVHDRYLLHTRGRRFETPQFFWMRVAMGLAMNEGEQKNERAIEFYELLSSFRFCSSTPTLFNSGTLHPQLSSCYLSTVMDDLDHIFKVVSDDAKLSKWAGGLGNDWTNVRATGSLIRGTNGESQGIVPFLKVANDTAVAVNQCFAPETPVHTAAGLKALRDVQPGDLVLGISGSYRPVTKHFTYAQKDRMVEIRAKHSAEPLRVTAGHPFYAIQGVPMEQSAERTLAQLEKGKYCAAWVDAGLLRRGDYLAQVIPQEISFAPGLTLEDARLYGILLGDGHLCAGGYEWGVSGAPGEEHLVFVREYLRARGIHFWETGRGETYAQIKWSAGKGLGRDATTGRLVGLGGSHLPFSRDDLYNVAGCKRIAPRLAHLPAGHTIELLRGLIETDGNVSRGKEITFTNTSRELVEGLRYQLLRLGVPTAAQCRTRPTNRILRRSDGSECALTKDCTSWDVRVPAVPELAALVGARPLTKRNWIVWENHLFTRVRSAGEIAVLPEVHDLEVETDHSYMTTSALVHNGGKRKGAMCAYLETWHLDLEDFLDLRKNTGDERRRTHDMNTANWIPDLFMKRVAANAHWTLFSPSDVPDLHDLVGQAFERRYVEYEAKAERGEIELSRRVEAVTLWRKMLTTLFETGHPWITFKDPSNVRSSQDHAGVVHSSNLCSEILLNTSVDEVAVCNLGSVNLAAHVKDGQLDLPCLEQTVRTAMRMLDNVIDINYYPIPEAKNANLRHRPVGLGLMGFQDALYLVGAPYASEEAVEFADRSMEAISYYAILASTELAAERGRYASYPGSKWDRGLLPLDTLDVLEKERGGDVDVDRSSSLDWALVRAAVREHGMRNSNCMAIAPTATISNIIGVAQSIEPMYKNLFVKANLAGDFTVINEYLVAELKKRGLWDAEMVNDLKYFDGELDGIERVPEDLKDLFSTAFLIDPSWLIECASRRQKWIDMGQSLNLYMNAPNGRKLNEMYLLAWRKGLKTTYYLRTLAATQIEKSTLDINRRGLQPRWMKHKSASANVRVEREAANDKAPPLTAAEPAPALVEAAASPATDMSAVKACSLLDPTCEACQ